MPDTPPPAAATPPPPISSDAEPERLEREVVATCRECGAEHDVRQAGTRVGMLAHRVLWIPPVPPRCPSCQREHVDREFAAEQEAEAMRRELNLDRELPHGYRDATLSQVAELRPALAAAMHEWLADTRTGGERGLYLYGTVGTGKTFAATAFARDALERGLVPEVAFANVVDLIDDAFAAMNRQKGEPSRFDLERLKRVPLLVLDDLGAESPTPYVRTRIYGLVNARYSDPRLVTIYTSNADLDQIARAAGDRTASRIVGSCRQVRLDGEDLRKSGR